MQDLNVEERVKKILVEQLGYPLIREQIGDRTSLYGKGLGLDSADLLSLLVRLEDEFGIIFDSDEVADALETVASLVEIIRVKLSHDGA